MYTIKNPGQYKLKGNKNAVGSEMLGFMIKKCNNATSTVVCASFGD